MKQLASPNQIAAGNSRRRFSCIASGLMESISFLCHPHAAVRKLRRQADEHTYEFITPKFREAGDRLFSCFICDFAGSDAREG